MTTLHIIIITVIILSLFVLFLVIGYRLTIVLYIKKHREKLAKEMRFLQIKIPKQGRKEESESTVQNMKQNIERMNQLYKNFYAIYEDKRSYKKRGNNYISMEMFIEKEMIKFVVGVPADHLENMEKMISSFYTGAVIDVIEQPKMLEAGKYMAGGEFQLSKGNVYPLKTYESFEADPMDSLLSAYSKVQADEKMSLQVLVSPLHEEWLKRLRKKADDVKEGKEGGRLKKLRQRIRKGIRGEYDKKDDKKDEEKKHNFSQQQLGDFDKKMDDELFAVKIRTLVTSPQSHRPDRIINDLARTFNQYNYVGLNTYRFEKATNIRQFARDFIDRIFFTDWGLWKNIWHYSRKSILNIKELSSILHFPHAKFNKNPRLSRQKYKIVPAPDSLPTEGALIGHNTYGGVKREVKMKFDDRFRHIYIIGQTGTGKSTLMVKQAIDDVRNGNGLTFLDPHGDACEDILSAFPKDRIDDLVYFDLSNTEYPIAFNPLVAENDDERDIVANDLVEMFVNMYGHEIFGPRIQDYFRNACFLLMEQPDGGTLVEIMRLFTDEAFLESKLRNLKNPVIASRWHKTYKAMGDREKKEIIPFLQAKFGPFTTGVYVRNIIGQPKPAFSLYDAMQSKKIILCNLSKGLAGEVNSELIGRMIAMQLKIAAMKRAKVDISDRVPHFLYIDEFQNYVSKSIESILSEARKYRLGLVVAHQYIDQLKQAGLSGQLDLSKAIFGNVGTIFALKVGAPDAEFLEKEFEPEFSQSDLINMDKFKGIMKMSVDSQQSRPFSFKPQYRKEAGYDANPHEKIQIIKQISALKWGTKRELADKEIYYRVGV